MHLRKKRKEKTMSFGVNLMRSPVLYRAAQAFQETVFATTRINFNVLWSAWVNISPLVAFLLSHIH